MGAYHALRCAVHESSLHLVKYLLFRAPYSNQISTPQRTELFHEAVAVWVGKDKNFATERSATSIIETLARHGVDMNAAIVPELPEPGAADAISSSSYHFMHILPHLRRGDNPLAWAIRAHAACQAQFGQRLIAVVRCFLHNGASQASLSQRQRRSLLEIIEGDDVSATDVAL